MSKMTACLECGAVLGGPRKVVAYPGAPQKETARFCCTPCRQAFHNRRMKRGAELYDLLMAHNYERKVSRPLQVWSLIYRLLSAYRDADNAKRKGRQSWRPVREAIADVPMAFGTEGDRR